MPWDLKGFRDQSVHQEHKETEDPQVIEVHRVLQEVPAHRVHKDQSVQQVIEGLQDIKVMRAHRVHKDQEELKELKDLREHLQIRDLKRQF